MAPILKEECPQNLLVLSRTQGRKARNLEEWGVDQKERERERERESERTKRETSRFVIVVTRLAAMASAMNIAKRIPLIKFPNRKAGSAGQGQPQASRASASSGAAKSDSASSLPAGTASSQPHRTKLSEEEIESILLGGAPGAWNQLSRPLEVLNEQESSSNAIYSDGRDMLENPSCCNICDGLPCALLYESSFSCVSRKLSWNCNVLIRWCSIIWISTRVKSWWLTLRSPWTIFCTIGFPSVSLVECF